MYHIYNKINNESLYSDKDWLQVFKHYVNIVDKGIIKNNDIIDISAYCTPPTKEPEIFQ